MSSIFLTRPTLPVACAGMMILLSCGAAPGAADQQATQNARIAVADISRIFDSYEKRAELEKEVKNTSGELRERQNLFHQRISELEDGISKLSLGNPERDELKKLLTAKEEEYKRFRAEARRKLDDMLRRSTALLYKDIVKAIESYAQEHHIDLVIKQQSFKPSQPSAESQALSIGRRTVLYCSPALDITDEIVEKLNLEAGLEETQKGPAREQTANQQDK